MTNQLKYGTVCSGLCAPTVAWQPLGWQPQFFSEIEDFPSAVLNHHYPNVPNLGDMNQIHEKKEFKKSTINVLCGGTPCQSFSIAGLRAGLDDPRGNLALVFLKLVDIKRPSWVVWENVPGVLSSWSGEPKDESVTEWEETSDFSSFVSGLQQLGYGVAYRIFDAQYFGLAQRRKRVFVVGYLGNWRPAAAVLFDTQSMRWNPAPVRQKGKGFAAPVAPCLDASYGKRHGVTNQDAGSGFGFLVPEMDENTVFTNSNTRAGSGIDHAPTLTCMNEAPILIQLNHTSGNGLTMDHVEVSNTLEATSSCGMAVLPFDLNQVTSPINRSTCEPNDPCGTISACSRHSVAEVTPKKATIRRLTPVECERLQGFADNYTKIPYKGKPADKCPDGPRYKAIGNAMPVNVLKYIGERINSVETILKTHQMPKD